jgi:rhomboid protease GluP
VAAVLPDVVAVTDKIRGLSRDLSSFRRQLLTMTPRVMVTPALAIACVIVFALMTISGVHPLLPLQPQLLAWGANEGSRVVLRHEYWRLPASVFAHAGLLHLAFNMWCLVMVGPLIERLFGNLAALLIFLAAGIGGAIASTISLPFRVSVGASGAIFGIFGALLALFLIHRKSIPASVLRPLRSSVMSFVIFNMLLGAAMPGIDQAAHMGGLVTGFVAGLLLCPPWPPARTPRVVLRRSFMGVVLVGLLITVGNLAIRYRAQTVPPTALYEDFSEQIASSIDAYNRISSAIPGTPPSRSGDAEANAPARLTEHFKALRSQAVANLERLEHVTTPDPDLQAALHTLISGQLAQRGILDTLIQPPDNAKYPQDNRTANEHYVAQANEAIHAFEEKREAYLVRHDLKEDGPPAVK